MKTIRLFLTMLISAMVLLVAAQPPQAFKYQAVARDANGDPIKNTAIPVRISLRLDSPTGNIIWQETHNVTTNNFGLLNIEIGKGTSTGTGSAAKFEDIDWGAGAYFTAIEMDFGNGFDPMGTSELLSVPYALYAAEAAQSAGSQTLSLNGDKLSISDGNTVTLPLVWTKSGNNIYFNSGKASIGTMFTYDATTALSVTDSTTKNIPALIYSYNSGADNFFVTSRNILATIDGATGTNEGIAGLSVGSSSGTNKGIYAFAKGALENYGVQAVAEGNANADSTFGLHGIAYGDASTGGFNVGAQGEAKGSAFFNVGVNGITTGVGNSNYGAFGTAKGAGSGLNIGVDGYATGSNTANYGVYGDISGGGSVPWNISVFADANKSTATNTYAIYARVAPASGKYAGYFDGNVMVTGTLSNPSDANLKTNIEELNSALEVVNKLKPVSFEFKTELEDKGFNFPQGEQYGFLAQDIEKILPDLVMEQYAPVFGNKPGNQVTSIDKFEYKSVNYIGLIPVLTKAIQEQDKTIEALKTQNENLETELLKLKSQYSEILSRLNELEKN